MATLYDGSYVLDMGSRGRFRQRWHISDPLVYAVSRPKHINLPIH